MVKIPDFLLKKSTRTSRKFIRNVQNTIIKGQISQVFKEMYQQPFKIQECQGKKVIKPSLPIRQKTEGNNNTTKEEKIHHQSKGKKVTKSKITSDFKLPY